MSVELEKLLTPEQAAEVLGVTTRTLRRWMVARTIPYVRLGGGTVRFRPCDLAKYINGNLQRAL